MAKRNIIYSMTGFGRADAPGKGVKVTAEIKAVNNRFLELNLRGFPVSASLENRITQLVREHVERGSLLLSIGLSDPAAFEQKPVINKPLLKSYQKAFSELSRELKTPAEKPRLSFLLTLPDVVKSQQKPEADPALETRILSAVAGALAAFNAMRACEGDALRLDLLKRIARILSVAAEIETLAPSRNVQYRERLERKALEVFREGLDDALRSRLLMEVTLMADKADISEELTRLRSHCAQVTDILNNGGGVGKKLNFLQQELSREANTLSAKASSESVVRLAIDIKEESEKIREQIQNLE